MGAMRARKRRPVHEEDDDELAAVILTSSDDEEANRDLTIEIVERARRRLEAKGAALTGIRIAEDVTGVVVDGAKKKQKKEKGSRKKVDVVVEVEVERKRKKKKKEKTQEPDGCAKVVDSSAQKDDSVRLDESIQKEPVGCPDHEVTEVNNVDDNMVFRKLLRGPRYFDTEVCNVQSYCFNCGEEGHVAVNCTEERRRKPCFVCGAYGHNPRHCLQGQDCFVCKRRGHVAKDCPNKRQRDVRDLKFCLQCGDYGHDMFSCRNPYSPEDLQEIQCYMCHEFGHLCCVDFHDSAPIGVSCYNCGQRDHAGVGCCKQQMQKMKADSPSLLCHMCGEEGHFARGCTKRLQPDKWVYETSMPSREPKKHTDKAGSKSAPPYVGKPHKRNMQCEWARDSGSALGKKFEAKGFSKSSPMGTPRTPRQSRKWFPPESLTRYNERGWTGGDSPCARGEKSETNGFHKPYAFVPLSGSHKSYLHKPYPLVPLRGSRKSYLMEKVVKTYVVPAEKDWLG